VKKFIHISLGIGLLFDLVLGCTYCAAQDSSATVNLALIPLGILICVPFILFGLFSYYLKKMDNQNPEKGLN